MNEELKIIRKALKKNRNLKLITAVVSIISGIVLLVIRSNGQSDVPLFLMAMGAFLMLFGAAFFVHSLMNYNLEKDDLLKTLMEKPEEIVWIYYHKVQSMPYGVQISKMCTLHFHLRDRNKYTLRISEKAIIRLVELLQIHLPYSTFGHSTENEQLYLANPDMLLKNDDKL